MIAWQAHAEGRLDLLADDHPPCVYIMNHQGFLDLSVMCKYMPKRTAIIGPST